MVFLATVILLFYHAFISRELLFFMLSYQGLF